MVSILIVNYNGIDFIEDCLNSLERQTFKDFEVIIVDNGSADCSLTRLNAFLADNPISYPFRVVPLSENIGFSGGNKAALGHANGEFVALLNNDTEPDEKWLEKLMEGMGNDPAIGICASRLIVYQSDIVDSAGDGYSTALKGFKRGEGRNENAYDNNEYVFGACAGAALYRRRMIKEIGFLDEDFFLIYEDTDLNFRAQLGGWKVLFVPMAVVWHKVRSSIGVMSDSAVYYSLRNSELVRIKDVPACVFIICMPEFLINLFAEFVYFVIKHKKFRLYCKAKRDALRMFPKMYRKRKAIMKSRRVDNRYILDIMTPVWQKDFFKAKIKRFLHD
ncbi:MAG: glycosyltransferase family 2 protein [Syntrophus sp. (in: bacteria)]|nr:glycosyltransferase family 2 protein [Syntrophus sp. (in: bacteria)]